MAEIEISNVKVFNFEGAFRGLRNPMNSWARSDSYTKLVDGREEFHLGEADRKLAQRLIRAGTDHSKFLRQIFVSMDINAPIYWWKEYDTYKIATVANSCSTMHKITSTPIDANSFCLSAEDVDTWPDDLSPHFAEPTIELCEWLRQRFNETGNKNYWRALIQLLPQGWMQKRTWTGNYQNLRNMYFSRQHHKLKEWSIFLKVIESLPYAKELITHTKK